MDWTELFLNNVTYLNVKKANPTPPRSWRERKEEKNMGVWQESVRSVRKCPLLLTRGAGKRRKERRSGKMNREKDKTVVAR
ncbi:hypothetical protein TNCT_627881 [Trichonephila clavata]|uniref:Uncharacterized protein n=1 Tax=Trichonephila clavata TaxID=2740835 RepID=A0A8X6KXV5_TRICU|nr:hypothetical protein TNCT_627881 [Trichonephila clavata]